MEINLESIIFYVLLLDAIGANLIAYGGGQSWWKQNLAPIARHIPLAKGWTTYYLILVLFIGYVLMKHNILWWPF